MAAPLIFDRAGLRAVDERALADYGIPVLVLMENAGRALAAAVLERRPRRVLVVCGRGKNGGDGLVAARHLHNAGVAVEVALLAPAERYREAAGAQLRIIERMGLAPHELTAGGQLAALLAPVQGPRPDAIIDAIFGTGLTRPTEGCAAEVIVALNAAGIPIVAADLPSGMDCDTGKALGACIRATTTVSFCGHKVGFAAAGAAELTGRVVIGDIGAPRELLNACAQPVRHG